MAVGTVFSRYDTVRSPQSYSQIEVCGPTRELVSSIGVCIIPKGLVLDGEFALEVDLVAEVRFENEKYIVVDYAVNEYGIGDSSELAQEDLLSSLVDYMASLESRQNRLAKRERDTLQTLREMLTRV